MSIIQLYDIAIEQYRAMDNHRDMSIMERRLRVAIRYKAVSQLCARLNGDRDKDYHWLSNELWHIAH